MEPSKPKTKREIPDLIPIRDIMSFDAPRQYRYRRSSIATQLVLNVLAGAENSANLRASNEMITMTDSEPEESFGKLEWVEESDSDL